MAKSVKFSYRPNETPKDFIKNILRIADIKINGKRPWDIKVHNQGFYKRVLSGSLPLGESYIDGDWDVEKLDKFFYKLRSSEIDKKIRPNLSLTLWFLESTILNKQRKSKAPEIGEKHYDIGNDLYKAMLDKRMVYTCGYWRNAKNLDEAQEAKLDLVCRKINLKKGDRVLDIGCGWGSFAKYAAEKYGAKVTGITVSKEQVKLGRKLCAGLPVEIKFQDYRDVKGKYDHVVSLGMFEHVGKKNYREFMETVARHLKDDGLFLLHTIGNNRSVIVSDPWIEKYIFPNSIIPSIKRIGASIEELFVMEDWHNFGTDYDRTLMAWFKNFNKAWPKLKPKYGERFYRMWKYFLLASAGSFRARKLQLWQIVLSKKGSREGYLPVK